MKQPAVILGELMENSRRRRAWLLELRPAADGIGKMIENPILWIHSFAGILGTNNEMLVYTYSNVVCEYVTAAIVPHRGQLSTHTQHMPQLIGIRAKRRDQSSVDVLWKTAASHPATTYHPIVLPMWILRGRTTKRRRRRMDEAEQKDEC